MLISNFKKSFFVCVFTSLSACTAVESKNGESQWDFDHNIQFKKTKLAGTRYHLEIIRQKNTSFSLLSTFLLRESYDICGGYGFNIEVLSGIEDFDDRRAMPNAIFGSLIANLDCAPEVASSVDDKGTK
jgi:hypothetical protein